MKQKNILAREEYKYYVPITIYPHLAEDLKKFTVKDGFAKSKEGFYKVSSIYFENMKMRSYFDKIDGQAKRIKLRSRYYPESRTGTHNMEFKYKIYDKSIKRKTSINQETLEQILSNKLSELNTNEPFLSDLVKFIKTNHFLPFIRIDYKRRALYGKNDKNIRITFDTEVKGSRYIKNCTSEPYIPALPGGSMILEIKTPNYFPFWLTTIIKKYSLKKSAISKYTLATQNLAINSSLYVK